MLSLRFAAFSYTIMATFYSLQVQDIRVETDDAVSIAFHVPDSLKENFRFTQGQYITLRTELKGEDVRRSYSICSAPMDDELRVAVKRVEGGLFSTYANRELQVGDTLDVMEPNGRFYTELDSQNSKNYVAFAAGSGITPIMSIMRTVLETEPGSEFTLFYGNKNVSSIIFREQIEDLKNVYTNRLRVFHVLSREHPGAELFYGRIDGEKCTDYFRYLVKANEVDEFFLCGPEPMIHAVTGVLEGLDVPQEKVHYELFTSPAQLEGVQHATAKAGSVSEDVENANITVVLDSERSSFELSTEGETILDAAMEKGLDVPFACKGAVCMTCRAKLLEGEARMDKNYALTDQEVEQGYILTCQAHPTSSSVVVSFDD